MKAISIQQPWASLICCGLKDVENRTWAVKSTPMKVLIHAGAKRQDMRDDNMPYPYWWDVENYQQMGILPSLQKTPVSCIVGVATITNCVTDSKSIWAGEGSYHWVMSDVKMFKKPIAGVKGKLGFFEIPEISEDNLPEFADTTPYQVDGLNLKIPLNRELFEKCTLGAMKELELNITSDEMYDLLMNEDGTEPKPFDTAILTCEGESESLPIEDVVVDFMCEDNGEPFFVEVNNEKYYWYYLTIRFK